MVDSFSLAPMVPAALIAVLAAVGLGLAGVAMVKGGSGWALRALALAVLVAALANPLAVREEHEPQRDVALIVVDRTSSQEVGDRRAETAAALKSIGEGLAQFEDLEVRTIEITDDNASSQDAAGDKTPELPKEASPPGSPRS